MPYWLELSAAIFSIISGVIAIAGLVSALLSPNVRELFTVKWEYRQMRPAERDILKVIKATRTAVLIRQDNELAQFIQLEPKEDGPYVEKSHLTISGHYWSALEKLVHEGYLRKRDGEDGITYVLTSLGERFIERFKGKLEAHRYAGTFLDAVQDAKVKRLSVQIILGTVHTAIGAPPLGEVDDPYATTIACIPPKERMGGIVAIAYIIGKDLPVNEGDMVFVKFEQTPYHIDTYPSPRWIYRVSEDVDEHVPTGNFTVRNIHSVRTE